MYCLTLLLTEDIGRGVGSRAQALCRVGAACPLLWD